MPGRAYRRRVLLNYRSKRTCPAVAYGMLGCDYVTCAKAGVASKTVSTGDAPCFHADGQNRVAADIRQYAPRSRLPSVTRLLHHDST